MKDEEEVVCIRVFGKKGGDVVFEGKVSTRVAPKELVFLRCFRDRGLSIIHKNDWDERLKSFKGLNNANLLVSYGDDPDDFKGVLYVGIDAVVRKSKNIPLCDCKVMSVWSLPQEECETAFKCETLEELDTYNCWKVRQVPSDIGRMKRLKRIGLRGLRELKGIPEEIGELSNLEELQIEWCGIESLPKRLKDLKMLKSLSLAYLSKLHLNAEDLVGFSKLKELRIITCGKAFTPTFAQPFWEMIKSTTDLGLLLLNWNEHNQEMVAAALEENGSIFSGAYEFREILKRNKGNHKKAISCAVLVLAIRRWRNALNWFPKEMVEMIAMMLWNTRCDVCAWSFSEEKARKKARDE